MSSLLLLAAALKLRHLLGDDFTGSLVVHSAVLGWEILLGLWLACGVYWQAASRAAIVTFAIFAGVSLAKALGGERTCGCLGEIELSPWIMVIADSCILLALARLREHVPSLSARTSGAVVGVLSVLFAALALSPLGAAGEGTLADVLPAELRRGTWEITVVRPACPTCLAHLRRQRAMPHTRPTKRALLILGSAEPWLAEFYDAFDAHYSVSPAESEGIRTPQHLLVENAAIRHSSSPMSDHDR